MTDENSSLPGMAAKSSQRCRQSSPSMPGTWTTTRLPDVLSSHDLHVRSYPFSLLSLAAGLADFLGLCSCVGKWEEGGLQYCTKYIYLQSTTVYVPSSELQGLSPPLSRQRVCPSHRNQRGGGGHTRLWDRGGGSPNSDEGTYTVLAWLLLLVMH